MLTAATGGYETKNGRYVSVALRSVRNAHSISSDLITYELGDGE